MKTMRCENCNMPATHTVHTSKHVDEFPACEDCAHEAKWIYETEISERGEE